MGGVSPAGDRRSGQPYHPARAAAERYAVQGEGPGGGASGGLQRRVLPPHAASAVAALVRVRGFVAPKARKIFTIFLKFHSYSIVAPKVCRFFTSFFLGT